MGRNKPRSKAVDVTKSLLQPTSITDHIAVQVAANKVIQVAEDDLSPTQGSEAAFALRREGKLDASMKLCLNWRQGNCHNHAACSFAHVIPYFGVAGDEGDTPRTPGKPGGFNVDPGGGASPSSTAAVGEGSGRGGNAASNAPWPQRFAPSSYSAITTLGQHVEEEKTVPVAVPVSVAVSAQLCANSAADVKPEVAESADMTEVAPVAPFSSTSPSPPAVVSADRLRSILVSLTATLASKAGMGSITDPAEPADADNTDDITQPHSAWLREMAERAEEEEERATLSDGTYSWQQPLKASMAEFVGVAGKSLLGEPLWQDGSAVDLYRSLAGRAAAATTIAMRRGWEAGESREQEETVGYAAIADPHVFSTAPMPTEVSGVDPWASHLTLVDLLLEGAEGSGAGNGSISLPPLS
ncbi:conserved hypothetical protein [Leishmania braziliensis MHOM/BR/75/M2904]|uniref:C3H1-type domain-containing protein n=2 Tax=Leishmania braziliensis TaxID=5660 RepID=A4HH43_LEIBR|nr:conserved hypothetical protein [Leishmania braziliensis MHOM/BR/75/M2904]KAI5684892.1 hypothetical protein MNV84_05499 [Leishmania braziliensis]CAJ2476336.1 unnamed protein product [Leishmania braziliensis]CAJ2476822.1 unnamed protein product [Leishmania braziliensis]CAM39892.1 conserved hypothetical protein [Leishmania braziliensis MHOM/BR/75/M2904]SYZ67562.1 hypothetical_protein [Leishmania braziliensis MHOM/BR/75/M2904]